MVWFIYAIYLHFKYMCKWKGERLAWFAIVARPIALFRLVGIPTVFVTIHTGYIGGSERRIRPSEVSSGCRPSADYPLSRP